MSRQDGVTETRRREVRLELFAVQGRLVHEFIDAACTARGRNLSSLVRRAVRRQLERQLRPLFAAYADAACPPDERYELAVRAMLATWVWPAAIAGEGTQTQAEYARGPLRGAHRAAGEGTQTQAEYAAWGPLRSR